MLVIKKDQIAELESLYRQKYIEKLVNYVERMPGGYTIGIDSKELFQYVETIVEEATDYGFESERDIQRYTELTVVHNVGKTISEEPEAKQILENRKLRLWQRLNLLETWVVSKLG